MADIDIFIAAAPIDIEVFAAQGPDSGGAPAWSTITGKPTWTTTFDGSYSSLTGKPTLFDGAYTSLSGIPTTFPNDDVTAATSAATASTIVKRDASGDIIVRNLTLANPDESVHVVQLTATSVLTQGYNLVCPILSVSATNIAVTGSSTGVPDALTNGTISGTVAFGAGAASNFRAAAKVPASDISVLTGDITGVGTAINNIIALTAAQYAEVGTPDANTLYVVI